MKNETGTTQATLILFSFMLFLSAALMFALQPMVGKMLLPLVGGTPSGWIVALAFFQVMLLIGYFLAWVFSRFSVGGHGLLYIVTLGIGLLLLPLALDRRLITETSGPGDVFMLLTLTAGLPFIALSATSSTLQRLFTATGHAAARDPYFLYAASNLGSFCGLFLYPLFIEPHFTLPEQSQYWFYIYVLLMGLGVVCLLSVKGAPERKATSAQPSSWKQRGLWVALAFVPSSLLLGVTTHITTDVFSAPMIWVIPLGVYLLTFVVAFSKKPVVNYDAILKIQPVAVGAAVAFITLVSKDVKISWHSMLLHVAAFAVVAFMCHMRLAKSRPLADGRQLAEFYLMIALGGALGGLLNAFAAPVLFTQQIEYPLMMLASCLLHPGIRSIFSLGNSALLLTGSILMGVSAVLGKFNAGPEVLRASLLVGGFLMMLIHPRAAIIGGAAALLLTGIWFSGEKPVVVARNFYGIIKVIDKEENTRHVRVLSHGTTIHGTQMQDPGYETAMTTYYTASGPLGTIFSLYNPKNIAVMGLGTGTVNCYSTSANAFTFFEIDPAVVEMAKTRFTYLERCHASRPPRIVLGDARLEFAKLENEKFDLIILDVFSSDMIPSHLLTREAMQLYMQRLTPRGLILFHTSNRYFTLEPVIAATARSLGLQNRHKFDSDAKDLGATRSKWMAVGRKNASLLPLEDFGWVAVAAPEKNRPWSDDYTNFLSALRF